MSTKIEGGSSASKTGNLLKGLTDKSPSAVDASMKPPSGSVSEGATRDGVAPTPRTLGPREA